jgi:uncharacterized SAM-binding protein YcdF (DUF218 family)
VSSEEKKSKAGTVGEQDEKQSSDASSAEKGERTCDAEATTRRAMWGLLVHKPRWSLSWRGWLVGLLFTICLGTIVVFSVEPFLAVTHREKTDILVVEGWILPCTMEEAAQEFIKGGYQRAYTTGGPAAGLRKYISDYSTAASIGAGLLREAGVPAEKIQMVPARASARDRTYNAAVALKMWFQTNHISPGAINVVTEGAHARRTRLLFQKAFGKDVTIGIISLPNCDYDPKHWWRYSEGVREVIGESIAYVYARIFFSPPKAQSSTLP